MTPIEVLRPVQRAGLGRGSLAVVCGLTLIVYVAYAKSLDELAMDDRMAAINALEAINAGITRAEDERLVCERIKQVGSNRPTRVCRTVAELRQARQAAEKLMEERPACGLTCREPEKLGP